MTPDSVHLLTRSSQMSLFRDGKGRVRRAYYGARLHEPEDAFSDSASAPLLCTTLADSLDGLPNASGEYDLCITQAGRFPLPVPGMRAAGGCTAGRGPGGSRLLSEGSGPIR